MTFSSLQALDNNVVCEEIIDEESLSQFVARIYGRVTYGPKGNIEKVIALNKFKNPNWILVGEKICYPKPENYVERVSPSAVTPEPIAPRPKGEVEIPVTEPVLEKIEKTLSPEPRSTPPISRNVGRSQWGVEAAWLPTAFWFDAVNSSKEIDVKAIFIGSGELRAHYSDPDNGHHGEFYVGGSLFPVIIRTFPSSKSVNRFLEESGLHWGKAGWEIALKQMQTAFIDFSDNNFYLGQYHRIAFLGGWISDLTKSSRRWKLLGGFGMNAFSSSGLNLKPGIFLMINPEFHWSFWASQNKKTKLGLLGEVNAVRDITPVQGQVSKRSSTTYRAWDIRFKAGPFLEF